MLISEEKGKPEKPEKNLLEQRREPTTNSTHIRRRDTFGGRPTLSPLRNPCSPEIKLESYKCGDIILAIPRSMVHINYKNTINKIHSSLRSKRFRGFREQRKSEKRIFGVLPARKMVREPKRGNRGRGRGRKERFLRSPPRSFVFWLSPHLSRGKNTKNPFPQPFFAPKLHGNACYAG